MTLTTNPGRTNSDIQTLKQWGLDGTSFGSLAEAIARITEATEITSRTEPVIAVEMPHGGYALYRSQEEADADSSEGNRAFAYLEV